MKLKTRERYSLRMMMTIARMSSERKPVGLNDVARISGISRRYLEQLVPPLKNASLLRAVAGRGGGYSLAKAAEEIKLSDIIAAAIGPIAVTECAVGADECLHRDFCNCKALWTLVNVKIKEIFDNYTLADLIEEDWTANVARELAQSQH
jgi:Rrf2 family protein